MDLPQPSPPVLSPELLARVSRSVERRTGLYYPPRRFRDLERGLRAVCAAFGQTDLHAFAQWLSEVELAEDDVRKLASFLTTGETYFFREPKTLNELRHHALRDLIARRRRDGSRMLRLWSAGCCTGEEAYTLAIMLFRLLPAVHEWHVEILGTDINEHYLERARAGVYREWSFRNAPAWLKRDYFRSKGDGDFEIMPQLRNMVRFSSLNLATDVYPSCVTDTTAMDVIFCRNVLIYFDEKLTQTVLKRFRASLVPDGWFVTGPAEAAVVVDAGVFAPVHGSDALLFRNGEPPRSPRDVLRDEMENLGAAVDEPVAATFCGGSGHEAAPLCGDFLCDAAKPPQVFGDAYAEARDDEGLDSAPGGAQDGTDDDATLEAAQAAYAAGDCAIAMGRAMAAIDAAPDAASSALYSLVAHCLANLGQMCEARQWCEMALEKDRLDPLLHYLMATIMQEQGDMDGARACLGRVIYLDQDSIMAHFTLAGIAHQSGDRSWRRHLDNGLALLRGMADDAVVPHSGGLSVARLAFVMQTMRGEGTGMSCGG